MISARTTVALAAAKARGVRLGNPNFAAAQAKARDVQSALADERVADVLPAIDDLKARGATSLRKIAAGLNARGLRKPRGAEWDASGVRRVLARAEGQAPAGAAAAGLGAPGPAAGAPLPSPSVPRPRRRLVAGER